jgi:hypothetical protein
MMKDGTWVKEGHEPLTGQWEFHWPSDKFFIRLDKKSARRVRKPGTFEVYDDKPEFSGWKLKP